MALLMGWQAQKSKSIAKINTWVPIGDFTHRKIYFISIRI